MEGRDYWRCAACESVFLEPSQRLPPEKESASYRLHQNHPDDPAYRAFLFRIAEPLIASLPPCQEGLDYGCGPGPALAAMLTEAGHRMSLYDPLFQPDPSVLDRTYDFIVCTETAEHFHRPAEEFDRLASMLRPKACLAFMTRFLPDNQDFARWHYRREPTHVVFYRPATFKRIAAQRNLTCHIPCPDVAFLTRRAIHA